MANKAPHDISQSTTQLFLNLFDITNDFIILDDGAASLVITVSAMNFGLLSEGEQDATIYAYAALLNSLSYPVQIVIRSQPKDVTGYLKKIQDAEDNTTNPLYLQKIKEYRQFVESLVKDQNVLDKKFYIVIPFSAVEMGLTTQSVVPGAKSKSLSSFEKNYIIEKAKTNLIPRRDHLVDQLARIGLYSRQLSTQELIQMLYSSYNPESFEGLKVTDTSNYTTPLVQAKIQGDFMIDTTTMPTATPGVASTPTPAPMSPMASAMPATPSMSSAPVTMNAGTTSPMGSASTDMPEFNKTELGFSTPAQMSSTTPSMSATPTTSMPEPMTPITPITPLAPSMNTPMASAPTSPLAESPAVSTPVETPMSMPTVSEPVMTMPSESTPTVDPQNMINQSLNQVGSAPATGMPSMTDSTIPKVGAIPGMAQPSTES